MGDGVVMPLTSVRGLRGVAQWLTMFSRTPESEDLLASLLYSVKWY